MAHHHLPDEASSYPKITSTKEKMNHLGMKIYWPIGLSMDMLGRTTAGPNLEPLLEEYAHSLVSAGTTVKVGWMSKTTSLLSSKFFRHDQ